ncbi:MAG: ShlB/FhaC/HecB family hemolysin secretion/activation protein [Gammaproteobacteria bacterium]|nr:ShlB/FhaC/HecB family hemolysin secretion/activation protein [Gammaproteobacteria bacterium]
MPMMTRMGRGLLAYTVLGLAVSNVLAQVTPPPTVDPGALQRQRIDESVLQQQRERLEAPQNPDVLRTDDLTPGAAAITDEGPRFTLAQILFSPSDILPAAALATLAAEYTGHEISFGDVERLLARINTMYVEQRVLTARAMVEPQDISDGILDVRLVEGRVGQVSVAGNATTREGYITRRIQVDSGALVDLRSLERSLKRFNRGNDIQLSAELKAGSAFATTDVILNATEPAGFEFRTMVDNYGSRSTGIWRAGVFFTNRSLTGVRDKLDLTTIQAGGQQSYSVSYDRPINRSGGRVQIAYFDDHTDVEHGPLASLDLSGKSNAVTGSLRQPLLTDGGVQLDGILSGKWRKAETTSADVLLQEVTSYDVGLGVEAWRVYARGYWSASYTYSLGRARIDDSKVYHVGRGMLLGNVALADHWALQGRINFQHSPDNVLIASEQMLIGSQSSVRGYSVGTYAGDDGHSGTIEVIHQLPVVSNVWGSNALAANYSLFLDHGKVKPFVPPNSTLDIDQKLTSTGIALEAVLGRRLAVRGVLAYGFNDTPEEKGGVFGGLQIVATLF